MSVGAVPQFSPVLAVKMDPLILDGPKTAPPFAAEFPLKVLLVMSAALVPLLKMAPPDPEKFPLKVLLVTDSEPALEMAPPSPHVSLTAVEFPLNVLLVTDN